MTYMGEWAGGTSQGKSWDRLSQGELGWVGTSWGMLDVTGGFGRTMRVRTSQERI